MIFDRSSRRSGATLALAGILSLAVSATACAQGEEETREVTISPDVLTMYLESRLQKPAAQATAEEQDAVRSELTDIYLLSEQPRARELAQSPRIQAQLELQSRALLAQALASDFLANNQATDEEIRSTYDEQLKLAPPLEYKARHILVATQGQAIELIGELDGGADFAELAKTKSTGPSGPNGGDLGWFGPERMVPEFSAAVVDLDDGAYTDAPVQTQFGWHVILREDSREATPPPFESVRDTVKQQIEQQRLQDFIQSLRVEDTD